MSAPRPAVGWAPIREADRTPEDRGIERDHVRLLVSAGDADLDQRFSDLPDLLRPGDLLVVNLSATLPASLPASGRPGDFLVNLSTRYGPDLWVAEPRWAFDRPGPVGLREGETLRIGDVPARIVSFYPGIPRLAFVRTEGDLAAEMARSGRPIRYGYLAREYPLGDYQTVFARVPGSAEMPSAARPFSHRLVERLGARGVEFASIVLHAGVSSLETDAVAPGASPVYPEPFEVPESTVRAVRRARARGGRVLAVGTTVVRALESAHDGCGLRATRGFTSLYLRPPRAPRSVDGLLTGFHADRTTHLDLLAAFVDLARLAVSYRHARARAYLWHEFGDSQLILPN
ncbi:MAG TPA: S-adenosylmethionine:tRNA ribosyltransferase-isomerase [Thermoplasmata archaeon]|nr:S-adenosylmethionine:tRNA ribosyltransferase-isomerase [Thermoplasmata archaeon]